MTMKIKAAEIVISAVGPKDYPQGAWPEIALAGRSNVGKSSLINCMLGRRKLARTSATPGKTQTLNFYLINDAFYFVDLPGYGYAKVSKQTKAAWGKMIERYLIERPQLKCVVQVVDFRHPPSKDDIQMYEWLTHFGLPTVVVATKIDKISRSRRQKHVRNITDTLHITGEDPFVLFSSETGEGKETLWQTLTPFIT